MTADVEVIVLAGGTSRRWGGGDKLDAMLHGRTLRQWTLDGAAQVGEVIVAGPEHQGGPLAAIAAVAPGVSAGLTWIVAGDQPLISRAAGQVRDALLASTAGAAIAVGEAGPRRNTTGVMWRTEALLRRIAEIGDPSDRSAQLLFDGVDTIEVAVDPLLVADCDTPAELAALDAELARRQG